MSGTSAITINTNLSSLICQKYLRDATSGMNTAMERLSTGFKINSGKDDAAGYSVVEGMQAKVNGFDIIETNASMGLDMLTTPETKKTACVSYFPFISWFSLILGVVLFESVSVALIYLLTFEASRIVFVSVISVILFIGFFVFLVNALNSCYGLYTQLFDDEV